MRKLVVLCLAVGLALASSEQWVGSSPVMRGPDPNPKPAVFPFSPTLFPDVADTLFYDDGTGLGWYYYQGGNGWGVKFISPSDNVTLAGALIGLGANSPGGDQAAVRVYADDGPGGAPGTALFSDTVTITMGEFNYVPVSVPIVGSNFYIFYVQVGNDSFTPTLMLDVADNAPEHRQWTLQSGAFSEDTKRGDWLIRAVLDWTPQDTNAAAVYFGSSMIKDTLPNINFPIRAVIKNMGSATLPIGLPVRLSISGPSGYTYRDTVTTTAVLAHGATRQVNFSPTWHIPDQAGTYNIKVWTEAAGEDWPADDTISWGLSCAKWSEYYTDTTQYIYIVPNGPERAVQFNPADFSAQYPVGLSRIRADFILHTTRPWTDSSFTFKIYGDDGAELLYESPELEAPPGFPAPFINYDLDSTLVFQSGTFYVAVAPVASNGTPTTIADFLPGTHSWYGSGNNGWTSFSSGEYYMSAALKANYGVEEEGFEPSLRNPSLQITNFPNPVGDQVTLKWQVPNSMPISVNLYDATGRMVRSLYAANDKARVGTLTMDTRSLAAGIYLARLETANGSATRKLVIDR